MPPNTALIAAARAAAPKLSLSAAITRGEDTTFQTPPNPISQGFNTNAASGAMTMRLR